MIGDGEVAQARRWLLQRLSAFVLAGCVAVHLGLIVYASRGGLSAAEILGRTRGSAGLGAFYTVFVLACALHVPLGLSNIAAECLGWPARRSLWLGRVAALLIVALGLRAVYAVVRG